MITIPYGWGGVRNCDKNLRVCTLFCFAVVTLLRLDGASLQPVWSTNFQTGRAASMALDAAGNMYVTGGSPTTNQYPSTVTLKYDGLGRLIWQARYESITNIDTPVQLLLDTETNIYVLGYSWTEEGETDTFVIKYSPDGVPLWDRHRGARYFYSYGYSFWFGTGYMVWDPSGHLVVTSTSLGTNNFPVIRTTKYTADGQEVWTAESEGADPVHVGKTVRLEPGGTVSVTGQSSNVLIRLYYDTAGTQLSNIVYRFRPNFTPTAWEPTSDGDLLVIGSDGCTGWGIGRYRVDGSEQWMRHYQGRYSSYQLDPAWTVDKQGGFYVAGDVCNNGVCYEGTYFDTFVLKYDADGNRVWGNSFPAQIGNYAQPVVVKVDTEGNVYVGTMYYLIKCDANGNRLWAAVTGTERLANFELDANGDLYVAGSKSRNSSREDFILARFRQPSTTNLATLNVPLLSQALQTNAVMFLSADATATEPVRYLWRYWGNFVAPGATNATFARTNPAAGEYNVEMITSGGSTFSAWARVSYLPKIMNLTLLADGKISFTIVGERNAYTVEGSSDLSYWHTVTNVFFCGTDPVTNTINLGTAKFFRARREY